AKTHTSSRAGAAPQLGFVAKQAQVIACAGMTSARRRRLVIAAGIYVVVVGTFFAVIPKNRILEHTPFNHFALLAESWLHGRLDLPDGPPPYAQNNDFASYGRKWFIAFPPFPAVLLLPFVLWGK